MKTVAYLGIVLPAGASESLSNVLGPLAVRALLGMPRNMCPTTGVRWAMHGVHLAILGVLVGLGALLFWRSASRPVRMVCYTALGAVVSSAVCLTLLESEHVRAFLSREFQAGVAVDVQRWAQAALTALGALSGLAYSSRGPTSG